MNKIHIALIAHDKKKIDLIVFVKEHLDVFEKCELYATKTTGKLLRDKLKLKVNTVQSGPIGGDLQIGAMVANDNIDFVIFLRDPLTAQPHEPDVSALLRVCDVHNIPLATNLATAEALIAEINALMEKTNMEDEK
ncbi:MULTISPECIES: methylglyoxal synthase [Kosmotoga]|uniref:Methylglyoxal synthase n=1 Tax=Kosmotoga olearia (strain ATCC BAA-1733 / DSM 21960 / TBF 19.5.1) TaxID=521045 RepID=C5CDV5_KOSOT|nr:MULTISPECIES: methylglyoxal synthase [Kosmotoga]ACR79124.1 methylglyoxal synthase [Kosmotoga olearia TBF 19.5.1]OAA23819.1 methylglyoxal synthase [Kosmotoga sp. DU53]